MGLNRGTSRLLRRALVVARGRSTQEEVTRGGAYARTCHPTHLLSTVVTPASPGPAPAGPGMLARAPGEVRQGQADAGA